MRACNQERSVILFACKLERGEYRLPRKGAKGNGRLLRGIPGANVVAEEVVDNRSDDGQGDKAGEPEEHGQGIKT